MEHGENVVPSEVSLGDGMKGRELNVRFPLGPNVGGVLLGLALADKANRRRVEWILKEEC